MKKKNLGWYWRRVGKAFERKAMGIPPRGRKERELWEEMTSRGMCNALSHVLRNYEDEVTMGAVLYLHRPTTHEMMYLNVDERDNYGYWARDDFDGNMARAMFCYLMAEMEENPIGD